MAGGGAGGKEVGRLSIRVVPDMDGFREKVEAGARGAGSDVVIDVDANVEKARRKIQQVEDDHGRVVVDLDADTGAAEAKISSAARDRRSTIHVNVDESGIDRMRNQLDLLNLRFERRVKDSLGRKDLLGPSIGEVERKLGQMDLGWDRKLQDLRNSPLRDMEQRFNLKPHLDESSIEEMRLRLAHENFTAKVKIHTDRANMERLAAKTARDMEDIFDRVGHRRGGLRGVFGRLMENAAVGGSGAGAGFMSKMPDVLPNIGGLGGVPSVLLIVGALSLLTPALALLSQALVGLPALITAVALPIGTLVLGFGGIKKALEESGFIDIITGKKGKEKSQAGAGLKEIQQQVSDVFEKGFTPLFKQVAGVLPQLTAGLPFVAKGIVDLAGGLTRAISSPANVAMFDRLTNSVSTMLTNMAPGLQSFTNGMLRLITNVGDHLPGLGNKLTGYADKFSAWVERISTPKEWWGKKMPSTLDTAITSIGPVLDRIVGFVGKLLDRGLDLANNGDLMKGVDDFLKGLTNLALQLSTMGPVFDKLATLLSKIQGITGADVPRKADGSVDASKLPPTLQVAPKGQENVIRAGIPKGVAPVLTDKEKADAERWQRENESNPKGSALDNIWRWFGRTFTRPHTDHPVIMQQGGGGGQAPVPVIPVGPPPNIAPLFPGVPGGPPLTGQKPQVPPLLPPGVQTVGPAAGAAAPPPIKAPKVEAPKLPPGSEQLWEPLIQATAAAGGQINAEVSSWSGKIKGALDSAAAGASQSGAAIGARLAEGIRSGEGAAVAAAHHLADAVKGALPHSPAKHGPFSGSGWTQVKTSGGAIASQFADGLDGGFDGVVSASQRLMEAVHQSMDENGVLSPQLTAAVQRESQAIGIELDRLKAQREALDPKDKGGRAAIKAQMDQLRSLKDEFGLTGKESKYNSKYGGADGEGPFTAQGVGSMITQQIASGLNAMFGFGKANVSQLEQDLGMSGNGLVEQLGDYGINFLSSGLNSMAQGFFNGGSGSQTNIYTTDLDGAMKAKERIDYRESMKHTQRSNV